MSPTQTSAQTSGQTSAPIKLLSPTLHLYHYVLRKSINDRPEKLEERRKFFRDNLHRLAEHLTSKSGQKAADFIQLVPLAPDLPPFDSILDLSSVPAECQKPGSDRLYLETGMIRSRLAARHLHDTYLLRLTRYVPAIHQEQSLPFFANLGEHISKLDLELGQTVILAGVISSAPSDPDEIAAECLRNYFGRAIAPERLTRNEFLGSLFYIYDETARANNSSDEYPVESLHLACVFLYQDQQTEQRANAAYRIFQELLLAYHKINYFYSQSLALKKLLGKHYEAIERLSEEYAGQKWDREALKKLPQDSLEYYKKLSFLEDQAKSIDVNLKNYESLLAEIKRETGEAAPQFLADFHKKSRFYVEQIKSSIGFLSPGLQLFDKLMLSVQTQASLDEAAIEKDRERREAKLGQLLTVTGAAIAIGQIANEPIASTVQVVAGHIYKEKPEPSSLSSLSILWFGALLTILFSLGLGIASGLAIYRWFVKRK